VSLACEITGWHLEVTSEEEYSREVKLGYDSLMKLENVGLPMAEILFKSGYASLMDIVETSPEELASVMGVSEEEADATIAQAKKRLMEEQAAAEISPHLSEKEEQPEAVEQPEADDTADETDSDVMDENEAKP
jgi:N utilization substance protein A